VIDDEKTALNRAEEFLQMFKKGAEFTQELLKENERLRYRILQLEQMQQKMDAAPVADTQPLLKRIAELEAEKEDILQRIQRVEAENHDFAERYVDIETENNNLANLYIASYQLHSTLDSKEVLQVIMEIIINLVGAEEFAILLLDEKSSRLQAVAAEGIDRDTFPKIAVGDGTGIIGQHVMTGESYFIPEGEERSDDLNSPMVCIPLKIKEQVIGALVIYKLLEQKTGFAAVDYELFTLLAGHAATAIFSSRLYSESERRLSTIQGFLDLLTK